MLEYQGLNDNESAHSLDSELDSYHEDNQSQEALTLANVKL